MKLAPEMGLAGFVNRQRQTIVKVDREISISGGKKLAM